MRSTARGPNRFARAMGVAAPLARFPSSSDNHEVLDASQWLADGTIAMSSNPMGFAVMRMRWSANVLCVSEALSDARMASTEAVASAALDQLQPRFGYLTQYSEQLDDPWIEQRVLAPLLAEDWDDLISSLYHLVIMAEVLPVVLPDHARVIHTSVAGRVARLGPHRSPFGPVG